MENSCVLIPSPPPLPYTCSKQSIFGSQSKKNCFKGFHLGNHLQDDVQETGSIYSIYKQKIDSMFNSNDGETNDNSVQAKIEKMFHEIANASPDNNLLFQTIVSGAESIGSHSFSVDYLGSISLSGKVTSLSGLQVPLKQLYFAHKKVSKFKTGLTGRLEINSAGLRVQYEGENGVLEQLNPFPTIAVWSALKFVLHQDGKSYAFLPLITDPENIDKQSLFTDLSGCDLKYVVRPESHAPLFAVVMRKIGLPKTLECHGFVCQTSEDAIVIAATLYKSLMNHMKLKDKKLKNKNGLSCISVSSSITQNSISSVPIRPPRKKKSSCTSSLTSSTISETTPNSLNTPRPPKPRKAPAIPLPNENLDEILPCPYEEPFPLTKTNPPYENDPIKITEQTTEQLDDKNDLKRTRSLRRRDSDGLMTKSSDSGDILTKVTIPRSGSFLNAGGLTRYKSKVNRTNGQAGGSPLGFHELFQEFRLQEGLTSMDDILAVIINAEGMSFNDLKPIYKEFLLKLAVTLTKDELYQRSKSIMRRQKKKLLRKVEKKDRKIIGVHGLKRVFKKSFAKRLQKKKQISSKPVKKTLPESSISTSSVDTRPFRPKEVPATKKQTPRKKRVNKDVKKDGLSTSEDSDFFCTKKTSPNNRNSSSGYVSCSECSYDSDTCTCRSADKCYCSLGNNGKHPHRPQTVQSCHSITCRSEDKCYCNLNAATTATMTFCGCDTDSCAESNKCYCNSGKSTIFEQLKRRGFIPSVGEEKVVTPPNFRRKKLCKKDSNTRSTKSVEYVCNPPEKYSGGFGFRNEFVRSNSMYGRSFNDFPAQYSVRSFKSFNGTPRRLNGNSLPVNSSTEALSVKKSAEIAALFTDLKLSQTTDITHLIPPTFHPPKHIPSNLQHLSNVSTNFCRQFHHPKQTDKRAIVTPYKHVTNPPRGGPTTAGLYSARNGLYTIQSQSDSSCSENNRRGNLENTLGYLP